ISPLSWCRRCPMVSDAIRRHVREQIATGNGKAHVADAHPPAKRGDSDERDYSAPPAKDATASTADDEPWQEPIPLDDAPDAAVFPLDALPGPLRSFVDESAWALNCPADYLAVPMLALAGTAIGARRKLEIKPGWRELPCLYAAVVGPPGSAKTP